MVLSVAAGAEEGDAGGEPSLALASTVRLFGVLEGALLVDGAGSKAGLGVVDGAELLGGFIVRLEAGGGVSPHDDLPGRLAQHAEAALQVRHVARQLLQVGQEHHGAGHDLESIIAIDAASGLGWQVPLARQVDDELLREGLQVGPVGIHVVDGRVAKPISARRVVPFIVEHDARIGASYRVVRVVVVAVAVGADLEGVVEEQRRIGAALRGRVDQQLGEGRWRPRADAGAVRLLIGVDGGLNKRAAHGRREPRKTRTPLQGPVVLGAAVGGVPPGAAVDEAEIRVGGELPEDLLVGATAVAHGIAEVRGRLLRQGHADAVAGQVQLGTQGSGGLPSDGQDVVHGVGGQAVAHGGLRGVAQPADGADA
eukprot:scaffold1342_cov204-Pinguiococcus_pyrenoidosus.AAC.6